VIDLNPREEILEKARRAITLCKTILDNNNAYKGIDVVSGMSDDNVKKEGNSPTEKEDGVPSKQKMRARSHSDLTVPKSAVFEDEMMRIIVDTFPDILGQESKSKAVVRSQMGDENANAVKIFELYHRYYVEVHLPREMELIKIRTKCQQKYNSLRYVSSKMELTRREEEEIDWIMMEMKRAIDRLNREGVQLTPQEQEEMAKQKSQEKGNGKNSDQGADGHRKSSSQIIPVLAHRGTWSETSDTIFQLNIARQQQYQATKDLEDSLTSREIVKSWYEDKIAG